MILLFLQTLAKWNSNGTVALSFEELRDWLSETSHGDQATDDEVSWIAHLANMKKLTFKENRSEAAQASVLPQDFTMAVQAWLSYCESKHEIDECFAQFDGNNANTLDETQLADLLTSLNEGTRPDDHEIHWVMQYAHAVSGTHFHTCTFLFF